MKFNNFNKVLFSFCFICLMNPASAAKITYEAIDLSDTIPGEDLWQYSYTVSDYIFNVDYGFSISFDYLLYDKLEDPSLAVNVDWDILTLQPDNALPDNGIYDALSLSNEASLADPFTLNFVWTGSGSPSAQAYDIYDDSFNVVASGFTSPVPEPSPIFLMLLASGLIGFFAHKKRFL